MLLALVSTLLSVVSVTLLRHYEEFLTKMTGLQNSLLCCMSAAHPDAKNDRFTQINGCSFFSFSTQLVTASAQCLCYILLMVVGEETCCSMIF